MAPSQVWCSGNLLKVECSMLPSHFFIRNLQKQQNKNTQNPDNIFYVP
ncbi:unnamed protein product [Plutella xylostella]|uniref:(diamondback moth) hypothetical protein n=1 Tax=Plutella xylostella TaxID=51655 RepID=A0A8S4G2F8_PLUXY|nr:unnamed protein product [Plutella xylostella]